ncbi:ATPase YjeE [Mycobacterium intracellulare subsp. yongonense]|nr:ATPase YjeE [Mycobacterium intracellulare subsp. yongonense]ARR84943.1 ATPase YjeE [Mycobacterium intracellulare subsp. yongonense]
MAEFDGGDPPRPAAPRLRSPRGEGTATCERVEDTIALGTRLGEQLRAGDVVVLSGPLGAGKTVLAKGIAAAMDVDGPVTSPSYVLARVHPPRRENAPTMIHVDMYRLLDHTDNRGADLLGELDSLDLDSDLDDAVVVVEWGEGLVERLAERHLDIRLERLSGSDVRIATWQWAGGEAHP